MPHSSGRSGEADADDDENWDLLDAFEGALGTHAPAKKTAPVQEEPEPWDAPAEPPKLPKAKSPPRRRAPPARRGSGYRSGASSLSEPLEKIAEASDEDSDDGGAALLQRRSQDDVPDDLSAVSSLKDDDQPGAASRKRKPHPLSPHTSAHLPRSRAPATAAAQQPPPAPQAKPWPPRQSAGARAHLLLMTLTN